MSVSDLSTSGLLTVRQLADYLSVSVTKARELVRDGRVASMRIDRCVRVRKTDADAFINSEAVAS